MDIGAIIRSGRKKLGLTQRALAQRLAVAPSAVAQWELDATKPSLDNRVDLAAVLKIPFVELLPEAKEGTEISSRDPETIALVRRFEELPPPVRQAILMQVVATADSLRSLPKGDPEKK
jgi:transcriptional regulator with XRE-family HTH domain